MTKKEKLAKLAELVQGSKQMLKDAEAFADEHALTFKWDREYGSKKQEYFGTGSQREMYDREGDDYDYKMRTIKKGRWMSSSDDCD